MPAFQYWFSGAAIFLLLSFLVTVFLGVIPMIHGKRRGFTFSLLAIGLAIGILGWRTAAEQEEKSAIQSGQLKATQDSLSTMRAELVDLMKELNTGATSSIPPADIALLAPDAPDWLRAAYNEVGQKEISGPQENRHIVEYFKTIGAKKSYRDDIDDWAAAFVEWSLNTAKIAGAKSDEPFDWLDWGTTLDRPKLGCVVVLSFSGLHHMGFYFGEDERFVRILGGNQDDGVTIFRYPKASVFGYRWPPNVPIPKS